MKIEPDSDSQQAMALASRQRGIALIAVLFGLTLLALFAAGLARDTRTEILLTRNSLASAQAQAAADAAVYRAIADIAISAGGASAVVASADPQTPAAAASEGVRTVIADEGGKIDLNRGHPDHLRQLLKQLDVANAEGLSDAISDFRDADDSARDDGAEWPEYRAAGLPYVAHNRPFRSVAELRLVLGMNEEIFQRLRPYVTVYSRRRGVDPRYAPEMVLRAIPGLGESAIDEILETRDGQLGGRGANPRGAYFNRSNRRSFTVFAEAEMADGGRFLRHAVIELSGRRGGHRVHVWQAGQAGDVLANESPRER